MRKTLLTALSVALAAAAAHGTMGSLVKSFGNYPRPAMTTHYGLAADSSYVYSYAFVTYQHIYRMLRTNGSLISSYPCPLGTSGLNGALHGLSYGGGPYLYASNYCTHVVAKFYASSGSLISTWEWPTGSRWGLCSEHDGTNPASYLWQSHYQGNFWRYTTDGSLVSSFNTSELNEYDLAWDYGNKLIWYPNYNTDCVYGITTSGSLVAQWRVPSGVSGPYGIAYYGEYLYVSTAHGYPDDYIWVYHCPGDVGVAPASIGKVKALFR